MKPEIYSLLLLLVQKSVAYSHLTDGTILLLSSKHSWYDTDHTEAQFCTFGLDTKLHFVA